MAFADHRALPIQTEQYRSGVYIGAALGRGRGPHGQGRWLPAGHATENVTVG